MQLRTNIIRARRPFVVVTEAEFASVESAVREMVTQLGLPAEVLVTSDGPVTTLRVRIDGVAADASGYAPETPAIDLLLEDGEDYRVVLIDGRFVGTTGFELRSGDTVAVPVAMPSWETIAANDGILELSLSWRQ